MNRRDFAYYPEMLAESAQRIRDQWGERVLAGGFQPPLARHEVEELLRRIDDEPEESFSELVGNLLSVEVRAVALVLVDLPAESRLEARCRIVLQDRWHPAYTGVLWQGLQRQPQTRTAAELIVKACTSNRGTVDQCEPDLREVLLGALSAESFPKTLGAVLARGSEPFRSQILRFGVAQESALMLEALHYCLIQGDTGTFLREEGSELAAMMAKFQSESEFAQVVDQYLSVMPTGEFHREVMSAIQFRLGKPYTEQGDPPRRVLDPRWAPVSEGSRKKFQAWLNGQELHRFFHSDNERLQYWLKYVDRMQDVGRAPAAGAVIMEFGSFVVVEFTNIGNAAYIYDLQIFQKQFGGLSTAMKAQSEGALKDRARARERLIHGGDWPWRFDRAMRRLQEPNFWRRWF